MRSATRSAVGSASCRRSWPSARNTTVSAEAAAFGIVGHHDDGLPEVVDGLAQEREDVLAGPRVERPGRLVGEDDLGPGDERAGDRDALLLAAGELARRCLIRSASPTRSVTSLSQASSAFCFASRSGRVMFWAAVRDGHEVEGLEDEADALAAQPAERVLARGRRARSRPRCTVPERGTVETRCAVEERALPGPGGPHHGGVRARSQRERELAQCRDEVIAAPVGLADVGQLHGGGHRGGDGRVRCDFGGGHRCLSERGGHVSSLLLLRPPHIGRMPVFRTLSFRSRPM